MGGDVGLVQEEERAAETQHDAVGWHYYLFTWPQRRELQWKGGVGGSTGDWDGLRMRRCSHDQLETPCTLEDVV